MRLAVQKKLRAFQENFCTALRISAGFPAFHDPGWRERSSAPRFSGRQAAECMEEAGPEVLPGQRHWVALPGFPYPAGRFSSIFE
jgi:hypothetical protein